MARSQMGGAFVYGAGTAVNVAENHADCGRRKSVAPHDLREEGLRCGACEQGGQVDVGAAGHGVHHALLLGAAGCLAKPAFLAQTEARSGQSLVDVGIQASQQGKQLVAHQVALESCVGIRAVCDERLPLFL